MKKKNKDNKKNKTVLLALSGGVDSSVAALILKKQGYRVICVFMKNFSDIKNKLTNECNWVEEYKMAQKIAAILELPLIKLDFEHEYKTQVINPMFQAYKRGITPNPDVTCNTIIKFPLLWKHALNIKAGYIATGHYARIKKTKRGYELLQARDKKKDQSYFLSELSQKDLSHTLFPIGNLTKTQVREIAKKHKLPNHNKSSTKGVCFIGNIPLKSFLAQRLKQKVGRVLNEKGIAIGTHKGAHYYTIGERARPTSGIEIQKQALSQKRFYIAKKDMRANTLIVVPENHPLLNQSIFHIKSLHWINPKDKPLKNRLKAHVRIRHLGQLIPAELKIENSKWQFITSKGLEGVAPGQYAVFYGKDRVICSGEIV